MSFCYPEGNFGRNQLLDGSISLSPLYPNLTIDLHVRIATSLHQSFLWLPTADPSQKFWSGRRCSPRQGSQLSLSLRVRVFHPNTRMHVRLLGPCFKTGRLKPLCQHPQRERGRNPAFRHAAFLSPNHHIRPRAITHPKVPHSFGLFLAIKTDVGPSTRKYTQQCQADPQPTRLTSNVSLSTISHTV